MLKRILMAWALTLVAMAGPALADDWIATKLRGQVLQLVDGEWVRLARGDVVPDGRVIRSLANGRAEFSRGEEAVTIAANTQIQIIDRDGRQFTTVKQQFGVVEVEAEVRNVEHFAVETPFMAAVVKGTRFAVISGKTTTEVDVIRGHVAVESEITHAMTTIAAGQSALAGRDVQLQVSGRGDLPDIVDANGNVIAIDGVPIVDADDAAKLAEKLAKAAAKASGEEKKALEKAAKEAAKAEEKAEKAAEKAAEKEAKQTEKAEKKADKAAEKTAKKEAKSSKSDD